MYEEVNLQCSVKKSLYVTRFTKTDQIVTRNEIQIKAY